MWILLPVWSDVLLILSCLSFSSWRAGGDMTTWRHDDRLCRAFFKPEVFCRHSSGLLKQYGEPRACWRRPETCEHVRGGLHRRCSGPTGRSVLCTGRRRGRGPVRGPVVRGRLRAAVSAVLVPGDERAPETHQPSARVPEQEADRYPGGAGGRTAPVLPEVTEPGFFCLTRAALT